MLRALRKWWKYLAAKLGGTLDEKADPKIQLEQAIREARDQHRRLTEQAANVIASQKQTEMRLNRVLDEYGKANASARQALLLADQEVRAGNAEKATRFNLAAESFANKVIQLEKQVSDLKAMLLDTTRAAAEAKAAVTQNSSALQQKLAQRERLLSQLDQAKMHEQLTAARAQLNEAIGEDVPTFAEVSDKIERRLAKAQGMTELTGATVESGMLEVEQAQMNAEAQARLSELRSELGLAAPVPAPAATPAPAAPAAERATATGESAPSS